MNPTQKQELEQIARDAMRANGLEPDFPAAALDQLHRTQAPQATAGLKDLRSLPWSSIDNDESRDLDQIECCVRDGKRVRVLVGLADVDVLVPKDTPLDAHAKENTTSVYTPAVVFPMLPPELSTDRTSLNEGQDRAAIVVEMTVDENGNVADSTVYQALVHNQAHLTYSAIAAWLDGSGPAPAALSTVHGLDEQLHLQDQIAQHLQHCRDQEGALTFDRSELRPIVDDTGVRELQTDRPNRAKEVIENFMIAANGAVVRFLSAKGVATIRRVVRSPERWDRIVELARLAREGARALQQFLREQHASAPATFPDLSLSVIKLLGRGEYVADRPGDSSSHFALAAGSYTHSTAPNRRYPDLITQRLVKAALNGREAPYSFTDLTTLATHCTDREDAANKVERLTKKAAAALWLSDRIGQEFDAIVTGAGPKGTWVRLAHTPVEGRLDRGNGLDVGDRVRVRLVHTDPQRGFIDFVRG